MKYKLYSTLAFIYQEKESITAGAALKTAYHGKAVEYEALYQRFTSENKAIQDESDLPKVPYDSRKCKKAAREISKTLSSVEALPIDLLMKITGQAQQVAGLSKEARGEQAIKALQLLVDNAPESTLKMAEDYENPEMMATAYEKAFKDGERCTYLFSHLIQFNLQREDDSNVIFYALEHLKLMPSAEIYVKLGLAYLRSAQNNKNALALALDAFKNARVHNKEYESNIVSLNIVYCLFQLAKTKEDYENCAKKLSSYLYHHAKEGRSDLVDLMLDHFQSANILVHHADMYAQDPGTPKKRLRPTKQATERTDWEVPADVKEATKKALEAMSFMSDRNLLKQEMNPIDEYKIDSKELYQIGDQRRDTYMYFDPRAKIPEDRMQEYIRAIQTGKVGGPSSQGQSCPKKLSNGRWEIKTRSKYRALSTSIFTFFEKPTGTVGGQTVQKEKTVIILGKEKVHNQVSKALR